MRRLLAVGAALVMVVALASSSAAAAPTSKVDRFHGSFDLVIGYAYAGGAPTLLNGHVVVDFRAPTDAEARAGFTRCVHAPWECCARVPRPAHLGGLRRRQLS